VDEGLVGEKPAQRCRLIDHDLLPQSLCGSDFISRPGPEEVFPRHRGEGRLDPRVFCSTLTGLFFPRRLGARSAPQTLAATSG
jgi:hypothetical protein